MKNAQLLPDILLGGTRRLAMGHYPVDVDPPTWASFGPVRWGNSRSGYHTVGASVTIGRWGFYICILP